MPELRQVVQNRPEIFRRQASEDTLDVFPSEPADAISGQEPLALGSRFAGRYTVFKWLGRGGFGTVYHMFDEKESRDVAIKVPHAHVVNDPVDGSDLVSRFGHEVKAIKEMQHPAIVRFYEAELDRQPIYLVTELIDGPNLRQWLDDQRSRGIAIDRTTATRWVMALASALDHAHGRGVIHRDVKPENIMLRGDEVVLTDFGLARVTDSNLTGGLYRLGTLKYMSPEQMSGANKKLDGRSDQYSLSVVLYELLAGQVPFARRASTEANRAGPGSGRARSGHSRQPGAGLRTCPGENCRPIVIPLAGNSPRNCAAS